MKKPPDIRGLADRLSGAAATPVGVIMPESHHLENKPTGRLPKRSTASVFLRLSAELFAKLDMEAIARTKSSGRGVTVQQIIIEKLETIL